MSKTPTTRVRPRALGALSLAAALALGASTASAGVVTLSVDAFVVSSTTGFVTVVDAYQNFSSTALAGGGLGGADVSSHTANDWNQGSNITAQVPRASATGLLTQFFDFNTGLTTAGFNLAAATGRGGIYALSTPPNYANALSDIAGAFALVDFAGDPTAGDMTFSVYYSMEVSAPTDRPATDYAQAALTIDAYDADESYSPGAVSLLSTDFLGGASGSVQGFLSWTFNLATGDVASFNLNGTAISSSSVPEPSPLALVVLALGGLALTRRGARPASLPA